MSSLDYLELCRLCLVKDNVSLPIFEDEGDERQIYFKISSCLPVKVLREDKLPKKICDECGYKVELLYQFWNTSVNAEKQLLQWLGEVGGLEDKQDFVTEVLDPSVLKQDRSGNTRLDGNVLQVSGQGNIDINMIDNMSIITIPAGSEQQFTTVPMDTSVVQAVAGPSTQVTHEQLVQSQADVSQIVGEESEEDNYDDGCDNDDGMAVKEETEEDHNEQSTFANVSLPCDEAGPSGLQQSELTAQTADGDHKSGSKRRRSRRNQAKSSRQVIDNDGNEYETMAPFVKKEEQEEVIIEEDENFEEVTIEGASNLIDDLPPLPSIALPTLPSIARPTSSRKVPAIPSLARPAPARSKAATVFMCKLCKIYFTHEHMLEKHMSTIHSERPIDKRRSLIEQLKERTIGYKYVETENKYFCNFCSFNSRSKAWVQVHVLKQHEEDQRKLSIRTSTVTLTLEPAKSKATRHVDYDPTKEEVDEVEVIQEEEERAQEELMVEKNKEIEEEEAEGGEVYQVDEQEEEVGEVDEVGEMVEGEEDQLCFENNDSMFGLEEEETATREEMEEIEGMLEAQQTREDVLEEQEGDLEAHEAGLIYEEEDEEGDEGEVEEVEEASLPSEKNKKRRYSRRSEPKRLVPPNNRPLKKQYGCPYCEFETDVRASMHTHITRKHAEEWRATREQRLRLDVERGAGGAELPAAACIYCEFTASNRASLNAHTRRMHPGFIQPPAKRRRKEPAPEEQCEQCDYRTNDKRKMQIHFERRHSLEPRYECEHCGKRFKTKVDLHSHIRFQHERVPAVCDVCGKICHNSNALHVHQKREHYLPEFECRICHRRMVSQANLDEHVMRQHEKRTKYMCETCGKQFEQPSKLKQHMMIHTGERPHTCNLCNRSFVRRAVYRQHLLIHTGKRPYVCDICGKAFTQKPGLICHRKSHPGNHPPLPVVYIDSILNEFKQQIEQEE